MDQALFSDMIKHHHKTNGKPRTIVEWIIHGSYERENSATLVLNSLVMRGILGRESKLFGRRYPTVDSGMTIIHSLTKIFCIFTIFNSSHETHGCLGRKMSRVGCVGSTHISRLQCIEHSCLDGAVDIKPD